jgi:hypothetical protein
MNSATPLEQVQEYKLVVQTNYRRQYAAKVSNLISAGYGEEAFENLRGNIIEFVKALQDQVLDIYDPKLKVRVLEDAYHTLQNASEEVGKIVKILFLYEREVSCESLSKFHFYEHVLKVVKLSLDNTPSAPTLDIERNFNLEQMESEPQLNFSALQERVSEAPNASEGDEDEGTQGQTEVCQMTIEELIVFIEASPASRKSKKKRSKEDSTRSSSPKNTVGDSEFEALLEKLRSVKPAANKVKPNLKAEWLESLCSEHIRNSNQP